MLDSVRLPELKHVVLLGDEPVPPRCLSYRQRARARRAGAARAARRPDRRARPRRRDQHPVHERHHRLAEGRDAVALQHRQQRALLRQGDGAQPRATGSASRCRSTTASAWCSACCARAASGATMVFPGESFDAGETLRAIAQHRCTALHGVPTMFVAMLEHPELRALRPVVAAHRHHGRRAVPDRDDAQGDRADAHARGDDRLRHDRDVADLVPVEPRRSARAPRLDGRPRSSRTSR